jgi:hypothetical protein
VRSLALALALTACGGHYTINQVAGVNHPVQADRDYDLEDLDVVRTLNEAIDHWDEKIGFRKSVPVFLEPVAQRTGKVSLGLCERSYSYLGVSIDVYRIASKEHLRAVFLHELAHAHLSCSDDDHTSNISSLMFPLVGVTDLDPETISRIKKRWQLP